MPALIHRAPSAPAEIAVSWAAADAVARPRLRVGRAQHSSPRRPEFGIEVPAEERVYTEALTGERVHTYHARLNGLAPDTAYAYEVLHDGVQPAPGTFRTGPRGRARGFRFTSFGDQAIPAAVGHGLGPHTPNAGYIVDAVDALDPLFHLMNGDLCYANVSDAPAATWASFFTNNMRSARYRPWMPAAGNHENEVGNGPQGYLSYQTRFELPDNGSPQFRGNWYAFTVGPVRVLSINNDDVCLQDGAFSAYRRDNVPGYQADGDDPYIRGYTEPAPWSAYRDLQTPYGFASFDLVPDEPGGTTSITVTHYGAAAGSPDYTPLDRFVMRKALGKGDRRSQAVPATVPTARHHSTLAQTYP